MTASRDPEADPAGTAGGTTEASGSGLPPGPRDQVGFGDLPPPPGREEAAAAGPPPPPPPGHRATPAAPPSAPQPPPEPGRMGLLDHLAELRTVLIQCLLAALAAAILCWAWSGDLVDLIISPVREHGVYFTAPNDAFMARLRVSFVAGLFVVAPFVLFRVYGFVLPGLHRRERRLVTPVLAWTVLLFYTGIAFAFFVVAPNVVRFLMGFGTESLKPLIGISQYLAFVFRLCLGFGLVFELPMLVIALCLAGIVSPRLLLRTWRYAIVIISILAAVFTPPDIISQMMMLVPMLVLYMGSVVIAFVLVGRRDRARAAAAAAEGD
ncbi:MAG: twin-arginine translocase subunit TatC [bacterium]|nr:twin-arginine translocase subunit TatC [bacterium]